MDIERYADFYHRLGDVDIQQLLQKAATLSRRRGRPEVLFIDTPILFHIKEDKILQEIEQRLLLQQEIVSLFAKEAPIGTHKSLWDMAAVYRIHLGESLSHEVPISNLLLPAVARTSSSREEKLLLQASRGISPGIKSSYNKTLQACIRAGLVRVGDIRNVVNFSTEFFMRPLTNRTINFLRLAL